MLKAFPKEANKSYFVEMISKWEDMTERLDGYNFDFNNGFVIRYHLPLLAKAG